MTIRRALLFITVLAGAASACAAHRPSPPGAPVAEKEAAGAKAAAVSAAEQRLAQDEAALGATTAEAARPDCARAGLLRDNVCALSEKICDLVARDPTIVDGPRRCQRARTRCQAARARVSASCERRAGAGSDRIKPIRGQ